jgi:hypothetical protein
MVTIEYPALTMAGGTFNPSKLAAFILPTSLSGLTVTYGGDSCADSPEAGTMAGRVFIPEQHAAFFPQLADPVHLRATINGVDMRVMYGTVDDLIIEDVAGEPLPELIPNSRKMQSMAGWEVRQGTSWATSAAQAAEYIVDGARVTATAPVPADFGYYTFIRPPLVPVEAGKPYVLTAMVQGPTGGQTFQAEWLDAGGAVLDSIQLYTFYTAGSYNGDYMPQRSTTVYPSYGATQLRLTLAVELDPSGQPWEQTAGLDGIVLHKLADGVYDLPTPKRRPPGRWVQFKAADVLATAARLIVGTTPWPQHTVEGRTQALNEIVPAGAVTFGFGARDPFALLAPRDIDKQNTLEIYQRVLASSGDLAIAATAPPRYIVPASLPRYPSVIADVGGVATVVTDPNVPELPAGAIQAGPLQTDITTMANQVRLEYRQITNVMEQTAEDASALYVNEQSVIAYGAMGRSISTDLAEIAGSRAQDKASRLATAQATPYYRLADKLRLVASQIPAAPNVARVYSADVGFGQLVHVADGPELLGEYHRVRAATITFGRQPAVELDVEPPDYAAPEALTYGETTGTPAPAPFDTLTLADFAGITLGELRTISAMEA